MSKKAVHIFLSNLTYESRLEKICRTTLKLKLVEKVEVLGLWEKGLNETEEFGDMYFIRIATLSKTYPLKNKFLKVLLALFSFFQFQVLIAIRIWKSKPDYTVIHNAALLPVGRLAGYLAKAKVIYEPHELESEQAGMSPILSNLIKCIEKLLIKGCHSVVCVCAPIAEFYSRTFRIPDKQLFVVTNQPENPYYGQDYPKTDILRKLFGIPEQAIIYLYQGVLDKSRGIEDYLDTFSTMSSDHHIVIMGYGPLEAIVRKYADICTNIHFKTAVQVSQILKYTASADVGLFVISDVAISKSYRLSLPNKFFEYAICGLHICISDNLELMRQIIVREELGSVIGTNKSDLKEWMSTVNKEKLKSASNKSKFFRRKSGWQSEEQKYTRIYDAII